MVDYHLIMDLLPEGNFSYEQQILSNILKTYLKDPRTVAEKCSYSTQRTFTCSNSTIETSFWYLTVNFEHIVFL